MQEKQNLEAFQNMFILSKQAYSRDGWSTASIQSFTLHYHPLLPYTHSKSDHVELHLLGDLFDYKNPFSNNTDLLSKLNQSRTLDNLFEKIEDFSGQYILIVKMNDELILFNDACAQSEIYYNDVFSSFASQVRLLTEIITPEDHTDKDAIDFYSSSIFKKKNHFVGNTTHIKNVFHLLSNHYIDLNNKKVVRFFPREKIITESTEKVAKEAATYLRGYLQSMQNRYNLALAVTGGYDSRVLFLASLETSAIYFVAQHDYMSDDHYDLWVPKKLTSLKERDFNILIDKDEKKLVYSEDYLNSVDFPRKRKLSTRYSYLLGINGNLSEIARNTNGYSKSGFSGSDFSYLYESKSHPFPSRLYDEYIDRNKALYDSLGFNMIDMVHWEEQMSNWAAKAKSETKAAGRKVYSPFNSRGLLKLLLSTKRVHRDSHLNVLYDRLIFELCKGDKEIMKLPINPDKKQNIIRLLKRMKVYNLYRKYGLKYRKLGL